jgi:hypothetical protein
VLPEGKLVVRRIREDIGFERNEQIMSALRSVVGWCNMTGQVTDVVYPGGMSIQVAEPVAVLMGRINQCQAELACPTPVAR